MNNTQHKLVSCVIPVVRNDKFVDGCVGAVKKSTYKNYEIVVVDEGLERSAQRNIGIRRSKGEFIIFLDSDMRVTPNLLEDCVKKIEGYTAVYIPERIITEGWFGKLRDWERQFYNGTLVDVVRFIRRNQCPFFDESLHGVEDSDWEREIIRQHPESKFSTSDFCFNHHDEVGLIKYLKKKAYYARCLNAYKRKNPKDKILNFKYRCFDIFVTDGKWRRIFRSPHMAFGVVLLLLARGIIMKWQSRRYK